jgi:hypothetical protein
MKTRPYVLVCVLLFLLGLVLGMIFSKSSRVPVAQITVAIPPVILAQIEESELVVQRAYFLMTKLELVLGVKTNVLLSWYGLEFHSRKTASKEIYDMYAMTCAHKTYPMGTRIQFYNPRTGMSCVARVNDRGPFQGDREFDVSFAVARMLGMVDVGVEVCTAQVVGI